MGKVLNHYKVGKHFVLEIDEQKFSYRRDEGRIAKEAALDGLYVIRTSVAAEALSSGNTVRAYKDLAKVERAFRSMKTIDLHVRPIYHWLDQRIKAHVFLRMLAYYVEWHMRKRLAAVLFDDHDRTSAEAARKSIVAPAPRSAAASVRTLSIARRPTNRYIAFARCWPIWARFTRTAYACRPNLQPNSISTRGPRLPNNMPLNCSASRFPCSQKPRTQNDLNC